MQSYCLIYAYKSWKDLIKKTYFKFCVCFINFRNLCKPWELWRLSLVTFLNKTANSSYCLESIRNILYLFFQTGSTIITSIGGHDSSRENISYEYQLVSRKCKLSCKKAVGKPETTMRNWKVYFNLFPFL